MKSAWREIDKAESAHAPENIHARHDSRREKGENLRISVIIPTLNEAGIIENTVRRADLLRPLEIIVVDGGSTDETLSLAKQAGACVVSAPRGRGRQLNHAASCAAGDVLLFLHADNWLDSDARTQIDEALADPHIAGGGFRQQIDAPERIYRWIESGNAWRARRRGLFYGDQAMFIRRDVFEQIGGFADVPLMEDVLLSRALRSCHATKLLPGPLHVSARRWKKHGVVRQTLRNWFLVSALTLGVSPERLARFYPQANRL